MTARLAPASPKIDRRAGRLRARRQSPALARRPAAAPAGEHGGESPDHPAVGIAGWMVLALVAVLPTVAVLARSLYLAQGDLATAQVLVASLSPSGVLVGSLYLYFQVGVFPLLLVSYRIVLVAYRGDEAARNRLPNGPFIGVILLLDAFAALITTVWYLTAFIVVTGLAAAFLMVLLPIAGSRSRSAATPAGMTLLPVFAMVVLGVVSGYFPAIEVVQTKNEGTLWVYVIGVDDRFTTFLLPQGGLLRVHNDEVEQRATCPDVYLQRSTINHQSLLRLALNDGHEEVPQLCRSMPIPKKFK